MSNELKSFLTGDHAQDLSVEIDFKEYVKSCVPESAQDSLELASAWTHFRAGWLMRNVFYLERM